MNGVPHGLKEKCACVACNIIRIETLKRKTPLRCVPALFGKLETAYTSLRDAEETCEKLRALEKTLGMSGKLPLARRVCTMQADGETQFLLVYGGLWVTRIVTLQPHANGTLHVRLDYGCELEPTGESAMEPKHFFVRYPASSFPGLPECGEFMEQWGVTPSTTALLIERFSLSEEGSFKPRDVVWLCESSSRTMIADDGIGVVWDPGGGVLYEVQTENARGERSPWRSLDIIYDLCC